jgi:hypothetical protein
MNDTSIALICFVIQCLIKQRQDYQCNLRFVAFRDKDCISIFPFSNYKIHPIFQIVFSQQTFLGVEIELPELQISTFDVAAVFAIRCNFVSE